MAGLDEPAEEVAVAHGRRRRPIDESALVLTAEGIGSRVHRVRGAFVLTVSSDEQERARAALAAWTEENQPEPVSEGTALPARAHPMAVLFSYGAAASLLLTHLWMTRLLAYPGLRNAGAARAERILDGEFFRAVTALTLHSNQAHVVGNVVIGGFFLGALTRYVGPGIGLLAAVVTGAMGNVVNALYHQSHHSSIGASTAVFATVGILSGMEAWRRNRLKQRWRGSWYPLAGGLGVLAMLGAPGGRTDFGAHAFGLLAGVAIGVVLASRLRGRRPGLASQLTTGCCAVAIVAGAWVLALRSWG